MLNTDDRGKEILHRSKSTKANADVAVQPATRCPLHCRYNQSCSTPMMRQIEAISRYALDTLGVRTDYISNLKQFKKTVDPRTLCYTAYMTMLDRLAAYAETLQRQQSLGVKTEGNDGETQR